MKDEFLNRIKNLISLVRLKAVEAVLLVTEEHSTMNVRYFSGFTGSMGYVVITEKESVICTDSRYWEQTILQSPLKLEKLKNQKPKVAITQLLQGYKRIGFEAKAMSVDYFENLKKQFESTTQWIPVDEEISSLRSCKTFEERDNIIRANAIAIHAFQEILNKVKVGVSEKAIALELEYQMVKNGAEDKAFRTIVASGERGALPHGTASEKTLRAGELIVFDFGCTYEGYQSDITRTVALGKPTEEMLQVYHLVKEAQQTAEKAVKAGVTGKDIDDIARNIIAQRNYGEFFGHGLGHGLGLETHEEPRVSQANTKLLPVGSVVTIEPGIYLAGKFGVRIENDVYLLENGNQVLTDFPTDLIIL